MPQSWGVPASAKSDAHVTALRSLSASGTDVLLETLAGQLSQEHRVIAVIDNLLEWAEEVRRDVLRFIVCPGQCVSGLTGINDTEDRGLLFAAISLIDRRHHPGRTGRAHFADNAKRSCQFALKTGQ